MNKAKGGNMNIIDLSGMKIKNVTNIIVKSGRLQQSFVVLNNRISKRLLNEFATEDIFLRGNIDNFINVDPMNFFVNLLKFFVNTFEDQVFVGYIFPQEVSEWGKIVFDYDEEKIKWVFGGDKQ